MNWVAIGSLAAIITCLLTLIIIFRKDKDKQMQAVAVSKLGRIEEKRLRLSVMPNLSANIGYQGFSGEMQIYLNNNGEDTKILGVKSNSADITLDNFSTPINIDKGRQIQIRGRQAGNKHIKDCEIDIEITYSDKLGNKYVSTIKGKTGTRVNITQTKEID